MNVPTHALSLREWLDRLQRTGRLAIAKPELSLRHEIAGVANRMDGIKATLFPRAGGQDGTVISGLVSDRNWMAEALGIAPEDMLARFEEASTQPVPWNEVENAPAQEVVHRDVDILTQLPVPT
ncbi:MAG: UbiD family decarboxylase, partial [Pararhizobium sp.]